MGYTGSGIYGRSPLIRARQEIIGERHLRDNEVYGGVRMDNAESKMQLHSE
jgi:Ni,Fe-hydrogenase III large subunit